jgi:uncharacterized protein (UPF0335 family)
MEGEASNPSFTRSAGAIQNQSAELNHLVSKVTEFIMAEATKTTFAQGQIRAIVERIERLEEEKKTIAADIKEVYAEAKGNGFDTKILRKVISLRKKDANELQEEEALIDIYLAALGAGEALQAAE